MSVRRLGAGEDVVYTLEVERVHARLDRSRRLHLVLEAPVLTIRLQREETERAAGPTLGEQLDRARIATFTAERAALHVLDREGVEIIGLDRAGLSLERADTARFTARADAAARVRAAPDRVLDAGTLQVEGEIAGPEIRLEQAKLERPGADLAVRGTLRQSPQLDGALEADFRLATDVVRELFPELRATGEVEGTARLALESEGLSVEADFRGASLSWDAFGPFAAGGRLRLADRRLDLSGGSLAGYGGRADIAASWDLDADRQSIDVAWSGVDLGPLIADFDGPQLPADLAASGTAALETTAFSRQAASGEAQVRLDGRAHPTGTPLTAQARARLGGGDLEIQQSRVELGAGVLAAAGGVSAEGRLRGAYQLTWSDLMRLSDITALVGAPPPPIDLAGALTATGAVAGSLRDPRATASLERQSIAVAGTPVALAAQATVDRRSLSIEQLDAEAGGGHIRLDGMLGWTGPRPLELRLAIEAVDLCALLDPAVVPACGVLNGEGQLAGSIDQPRWTLAGEVSALRSRQGDVTRATPGLLRFSAHEEEGRVVIEELRGILDGGSIDGAGTYDRRTAEITGRLDVDDLPLASLLPARAPWTDVAGTVDVEATVDGPASAPRGEARLSLDQVSIADRPLPDVEAMLTANGGGDLQIEARAGRATPFLTSRLELERPFPIQADLDLGAVPADAVTSLLADLPLRLTEPVLAGRVAIDGFVAEPDSIHARGEIERLEARYGDRTIAADPFTIAGDHEGLRIESLRLHSDSSTLLVSGTIPLGGDRELDLRADGDLPLDLLSTEALKLDGDAHLEVQVHGPWRSPLVSGVARAADVGGAIGGVDWRDVVIEARLAGRQIVLDRAEGQFLGGSFSARGGAVIEEPIETSDVELAIDLHQVDLVHFAPELDSGPRPHFVVDAEATLQASAIGLASVGGWIDLVSIRAGAEGNDMTSVEPTRVLIEEGRAILPELRLTGGGTDVRIEGATSIARPLDDLEASVAGAIDFAQLGFLAASLPGLEIGGLGTIDLDLRHGVDGIELEGGGTIASGRIASTRPRFLISDLTGEVAFRGSSIRLRELRGRLGGGSVEARASIELRNLAALESVVLEAEANQVNLEFGDGVRARFSGDALFQGRGDQYRLRGDLRILTGLFTRELDAASSETDFLAGVRAELVEEETAPFAETVELDLRLATEGDVHVDNELTRVPAGGTLRVDGTLARPELTGLITNTGDGTLRLGRNMFNLEVARITLEGYPVEPAYVEVIATTEVTGYSIRLEVEGPPDDVDTTLSSSDPSLTQGDLAALLTTGRTAEEAPEVTAALLEAQAVTYLGELFQEQLGLGLVFDTPAALPILSSESGAESRFTVGRRITDRLTVAYSVATEDANSQLWILDYQPLRRLWFRAIEESGEAYVFEVAQRLTLDPRARKARSEPLRIASAEVVAADAANPLPGVDWKLRLKPGQRYDYWRAEDAAEGLRRQLAERGHPSAQVEVEAVTGDDHMVSLRFVVDPAAPVRFQWAGDDPGQKLKRRIESQWGSELAPGLLVADLAARARNELNADGWYTAKVFGAVSQDEGVQVVELEVRLGPKGKGVDVEFTGNAALDDAALRAALPRPDAPRFFAWMTEEHKHVEDLLALRYAEVGFLDVSVGAVVSNYDPDSRRLRIDVEVKEGLPYTVESIEFPGAEGLTYDALEARIPCGLGEPFALTDYRESSRQIRQLYRQSGFPDATVRSRVRRIEPGALELIFSVAEGDPAVVGQISITGDFRIREGIVRSRLGLTTGEPLRVNQLAAAERELYRLGVFRSVEVVALDPAPGSRTRDIVVRLAEKAPLSFDYGLRYRTDDVENLQPTIDEVKTKGFEGVLRTQLLQPLRRADSVILSLFLGEERERVRLGYQVPLFFGRPLPVEFSVETGREARERKGIQVDSQSSEFTVQQRKTLGPQTRLLYGIQFLRGVVDEVTGLTPEEEEELTTPLGEWSQNNRLTASMVHDARDELTNPSRGILLTGTAQAGSPVIGADTEFTRLNGQFSLFLPLGKSKRAPVWASSYRAGAIWSGDPTPDPLLDLEDRFTAGGPFSVRGFETNGLGPTFPEEDGFPIGGRGLLIFNQELRFPIWRGLWGGVFYDAGNVFEEPDQIRLDTLRQSYGVGLRYDIGFGVLRGDVARVVDPEPGEAKERFHFSFGHAF